MSFANEDQKSPQETQDETKASNPVIESKFNHADFESYISIYGNRYDQSEDKIIPMPSESNNMGWRERGTSLPENRDLYSGYWHSKPPVVKPLGEKPSNEELLEPADQATGMSPSFISGSVQTPNVTYGLKQGLFIDNTVSVDDIRQYNLGDCFFLAGLLQLVQSDPDYITNHLISLDNGIVTTRLFKKDKKDTFQMVEIKSAYGMAAKDLNDAQKANNEIPSALPGARFRISKDPESSSWSANFISGGSLKIQRKDLYQAATWVRCLEDAYATFALKYGKYGDGQPSSEKGMNSINGGFTSLTLPLIYGDRVKSVLPDVKYNVNDGTSIVQQTIPMAYHGISASGNVSENSEKFIGALYEFAKTQDHNKDQDVYLCATVNTNYALERARIFARGLILQLAPATKADLKAAKKAAKKESKNKGRTVSPDSMIIPKLENLTDPKYENSFKVLQSMLESLDLYIKDVSQNGKTGGEKDSSKSQAELAEDIHNCIVKLVSDDDLVKAYASPLRNLRTVAGTIKKTAGKNIYVYPEHAYNVSKVVFKDNEGNAIDVQALSVTDVIKRLSIENSVITMQNPHASAKPVMPVNPTEDASSGLSDVEAKPDTGTFETRLQDFLANMSFLEAVTVSRNDRINKLSESK